ncbi:hypothetical protein [Acetobacter fallax]|uniref:Flagellar hook-length control protein-like C-terminal domain-containing protein n=1 Tax=Acetobacter fallax TaxID=1737473 RepID=A0ABX0KDE8_9PROT|nr:hypothetical protein [Acetobacter fallax]NHO33833.1 hypothetical protein [Acetobacter fallax]NHO37389.1 hypothetical protein [Acetobacter fallax]
MSDLSAIAGSADVTKGGSGGSSGAGSSVTAKTDIAPEAAPDRVVTQTEVVAAGTARQSAGNDVIASGGKTSGSGETSSGKKKKDTAEDSGSVAAATQTTDLTGNDPGLAVMVGPGAEDRVPVFTASDTTGGDLSVTAVTGSGGAAAADALTVQKDVTQNASVTAGVQTTDVASGTGSALSGDTVTKQAVTMSSSGGKANDEVLSALQGAPSVTSDTLWPQAAGQSATATQGASSGAASTPTAGTITSQLTGNGGTMSVAQTALMVSGLTDANAATGSSSGVDNVATALTGATGSAVSPTATTAAEPQQAWQVSSSVGSNQATALKEAPQVADASGGQATSAARTNSPAIATDMVTSQPVATPGTSAAENGDDTLQVASVSPVQATPLLSQTLTTAGSAAAMTSGPASDGDKNAGTTTENGRSTRRTQASASTVGQMQAAKTAPQDGTVADTNQSASADSSSSEKQSGERDYPEKRHEVQTTGSVSAPAFTVSESTVPQDVVTGFNVDAATGASTSSAGGLADGTIPTIAVSQAAGGSSAVSLTVPMSDDQTPVHVTIDRDSDTSGLLIHIGTEALTTLNELQSHRSELVHALESAGVSTDNAQISFGLSDNSGSFSSPGQDSSQFSSSSDGSTGTRSFSGEFSGFSGQGGSPDSRGAQTSASPVLTAGLTSRTDDASYFSSASTSRSGSVNITV